MSKPHKHAAEMLQYAQDAAETETPWERWRVRQVGFKEWEKISTHPAWSENCEYRRKPKTITINGIEVPEPMRVAPEFGAVYYMVLGRNEVQKENWHNLTDEKTWLSWGILHLTHEAAELHAKALLSFTKQAE